MTSKTWRFVSSKRKHVFAIPSFLKQPSIYVNFSLPGHFAFVICVSQFVDNHWRDYTETWLLPPKLRYVARIVGIVVSDHHTLLTRFKTTRPFLRSRGPHHMTWRATSGPRALSLTHVVHVERGRLRGGTVRGGDGSGLSASPSTLFHSDSISSAQLVVGMMEVCHERHHGWCSCRNSVFHGTVVILRFVILLSSSTLMLLLWAAGFIIKKKQFFFIITHCQIILVLHQTLCKEKCC